jgi:ADP-ribose pyrophosphatase YjhB (NUDIX family)
MKTGHMYIKIYFNDKPLFLCDEVDDTINVYAHHDDAVFMDELSSPAIKSIIQQMQEPQVHAGIFFHPDLEALKKQFWKKFEPVLAGGGLVRNEAGKILLLFRRGKWDLPKGKLDKGEKIEACALREVKEETGLQQVSLVSHLYNTYHTYHEGTHFILKETYWYEMLATGADALVPQAEEQIEQAIWAGETEIAACLQNTYPSVAEVLAKA